MSKFNEAAKEVFKGVSAAALDVIRYEGDNTTFVWKHPAEDFYLGSYLDVHEGQSAVFMFNGAIVADFGPGRHCLTVEEWPFLKDLMKFITKSKDVFHAQVYFIDRTVKMSLYWGTSDRVRFMDPQTGAPIDIGASGEMNMMVSDPYKLLTKLVGTTAGIMWHSEAKDGKKLAQSISQAFKPMIQTTVKANLANIIKDQGIDILEIDQHLESISAALREKVSAGFEEYGLSVPQFYVVNVALPPETDANFKIIKKLHTERLKLAEEQYEATMVAAHRQQEIEKATTDLELARFEAEKVRIAAQAEADKRRAEGFADAEVMAAQGYNHKDELQADVQKAYASGIGQMGGNGGAGGSITSEMLGLGIGLATMGSVQKTVLDGMGGSLNVNPVGAPASAPADTAVAAEDGWTCSCGNAGNKGKFCSECGAAKPEAWDCPACGTKGNKGKFCTECGAAKPEDWTCPACGAKGNKGKFCAECGQKKE